MAGNPTCRDAACNRGIERRSIAGVRARILNVMRRSCDIVVLALLTVSAITFSGQETSSPPLGCRYEGDAADCKDAFSFFHKLKAAVSANQRDSVALMVRYPVRTEIDDKPVWIATRQSFLAHYDEVVNPAERCAITAAADSDVWGNWQGYTIGSGVVWWEKEASKDDQKPGQEIDWTGIPFKVKTFNNIDVMTEGCTKLNVVQTLLPNNRGDAKGTVLIDFHPADAFFTRFQKEVGSDDREKVADMVRYPVNLRIGGQQVVATDRARFLQLYDALFQPLTRSLLHC